MFGRLLSLPPSRKNPMTDTPVGRGRGRMTRPQQETETDPNVVPIGAASTKTKRKAEPKASTRRKARELGETKPVPAAPRKRYEAPVVGDATDLPPRPGALDEIIRDVYEKVGDDPNKYVPIESEGRDVQGLQTAITSAARRLGQPIKTTIRVSRTDGKQTLYVRPL